MSNNFYVYTIRNILNNKIYVGKTSGDYTMRWMSHYKTGISKNKNTKKYNIHKAIEKYGIENFEFKIIKSFKKEEEAYQFEIKSIISYNSIKNGYNISEGGLSMPQHKKISNDKIIEIFYKFIDYKSFSKVAKEFKLDRNIIRKIIKRITYNNIAINESILNKCNDILIKKKRLKINEINVNDVINDYIVNNSIRYICNKYNISSAMAYKIFKENNLDQSIIDKNKCSPLNINFVSKIIKEYINTNLTAKELAIENNVSVHVINDILCGKTSYEYNFSSEEKERFELIKKKKMGLKITDDIKEKLLQDIKNKIKTKEICKRYNISSSLVSFYRNSI